MMRTSVDAQRTDQTLSQEGPHGQIRKPIAITMGDPAGIGPEIILRALARAPEIGLEGPFVVYGCPRWMEAVARRLGLNTGFSSVADYNYRTQLDNNFGQTVGVSLNIPIFSQLKNRSNVKLARLSLDTAELDRQQAEKELYSKVESAWLNATSYQAQEASSRTARDNAKLAYELSKKKYELGSLTNTDLIVSENAYRNAEQTYLQNKYMSALYGELLRFYEGGESREQ